MTISSVAAGSPKYKPSPPASSQNIFQDSKDNFISETVADWIENIIYISKLDLYFYGEKGRAVAYSPIKL